MKKPYINCMRSVRMLQKVVGQYLLDNGSRMEEFNDLISLPICHIQGDL